MKSLKQYLKNNKNNSHYLKYAKNIYSQNGDDGIIEQILSDLNITDGVVVEFGAWDGIYISNVFNLWANKNYKALLIESDFLRSKELFDLCKNFTNVEVMNCMVSPNHDNNSLDNLLLKSKFNITNDNLILVSIDVDSVDYQIFKSLINYSPKIVIVEYDTGIPCDQYICNYSGPVSSKAFYELGKEKGYTLVCSTGNLYFVKNDLIKHIPMNDFTLQTIHADTELVDVSQKIDENGFIGNEIRYKTKKYLKFISEESAMIKNA